MTYTFRGRLCGLICPECPEPLGNVIVRLYRPHNVEVVTALAVASPKETFALLTEGQVKEKAGALLAESKTDEEGNFTFHLGDNERYHGEAFEIDVYCATVPDSNRGRHQRRCNLQLPPCSRPGGRLRKISWPDGITVCPTASGVWCAPGSVPGQSVDR